MDYSSLPNDPDHPAGASPWASSPQHNRTTFSADVPPSPLPASHSPYSTGAEHDQLDESAERHGATGGLRGAEINHESAPASVQAEAQPEQPQQQSYGQGHQAHDQQDQQQRTRAPQYKLQAKITGLERTGRKDPILRFDVYVCSSPIHPPFAFPSTDKSRQTCPSSEPHSSAMYAALTLNSRSFKIILSLQILKPSSPQCLQQSQQQALVPTRMNSESRHLCSAGSMSYAPMTT